MFVVKYSNRKLYDRDSSSYVSQKDLLEAVAIGEKVTVQCSRTKNDITVPVLLSCLGRLAPDLWNTSKDKIVSLVQEGYVRS